MPSPKKSMHPPNRIADFDDEEDESDETEESDGSAATSSATGTASRTTGAVAAASKAASAAASMVTTAVQSLRAPAAALGAAAAVDGSADTGGGHVGRRLFDTPGALEDAYLQLTHSLAQHNQRAGRVRAAARCWGRRAELLLERGEVGVAQARLSALADLYQVRFLHYFICLYVCLFFFCRGFWSGVV